MTAELDPNYTSSPQAVDPTLPLPRIPSDNLLPALLPYDIEIADWQTRPVKHEPGIGHLQTSMIYLADGSQYVFRKILAENPVSDISADFMPPLATRTKGFNKYVGRKLAEAGINNRLVGTNRGHKYSLEHDAQAFLAILNHDDAMEPKSQPGRSLELGYSMGAMKGLGALSLAQQMGRDHLGIFVDPCLAEPIDYSKEDLREVIPYLISELRATGRIVRGDASAGSWRKTLSRSAHLLATFSASPSFLRNMYDKWQTIATGETGTFPAKTPLDASMVIHFFNGSRYNTMDAYQQMFAEHANVHSVEEDGLHLTGGCPAFIGGVVAQTKIALHLIDEGLSNGEVAKTMAYPIAA